MEIRTGFHQVIESFIRQRIMARLIHRHCALQIHRNLDKGVSRVCVTDSISNTTCMLATCRPQEELTIACDARTSIFTERLKGICRKFDIELKNLTVGKVPLVGMTIVKLGIRIDFIARWHCYICRAYMRICAHGTSAISSIELRLWIQRQANEWISEVLRQPTCAQPG